MRRFLVAVFAALAIIAVPSSAGAQGWTSVAAPYSGGVTWGSHFARAWGNPPYYAHAGLGGTNGGSDVMSACAYDYAGRTVWCVNDYTANGVNVSHTIDVNVARVDAVIVDYLPGGHVAMKRHRMPRNQGGFGSFGISETICSYDSNVWYC